MKKSLIITLSLIFVFLRLPAQSLPSINNSVFEVSPQSISVSAHGGSHTVTVKSSSSWDYTPHLNGIGNVQKNRDKLIVTISQNSSTTNRSGYITIRSQGKSIKVTISQAGAQPVRQDYFSISSTSASFDSDGGALSFTVSSSNSWKISSYPSKSAFNLVRNGNSLKLTAMSNTSVNSINDYFIISSGSKTIRVSIDQKGAAPFLRLSETFTQFDSSGGTKTYHVDANIPWQLRSSGCSWARVSKDGNTITLTVDKNAGMVDRGDSFTIESSLKNINVTFKQARSPYYLCFAQRQDNAMSVQYSSAASSCFISLNSNDSDIQIISMPYWCKVSNLSSTGFKLSIQSNNSSLGRDGVIKIRSRNCDASLYVNQLGDPSYYYRSRAAERRNANGGWVNMAIGFEATYAWENKNTFLNLPIGLRIGNYRDPVQFEIGISPGCRLYEVDDYYDEYQADFYMPAYASLKISTRTGHYLKLGASYNQLIESDFIGDYSLRAGFGYASKHFEWDYIYIQYNSNSELYDTDELMVGMRFGFYITK